MSPILILLCFNKYNLITNKKKAPLGEKKMTIQSLFNLMKYRFYNNLY